MDKKYIMLNGRATTDTLHDIHVNKGEDEYLYDENGNRYIDLASGLWNVSLGYNRELNSDQLEGFRVILDNNIPYIDMTSYTTTIYEQVSREILDFVGEKNFEKFFLLIVVQRH